MLLITNVRGSGIEGGVSRRITKGDVVIIPGHTPHWWSELETDGRRYRGVDR
jgi:quercetin dioxygenase-like cupin family protein